MTRTINQPTKGRVLRFLILTTAIATGVLLTSANTQAQSLDKGNTESKAKSVRLVFVHSTSLLVGNAVVEDKLLKQPQFKQLGFAITRDATDADIILELHHDLLTKYVFSVVDAKTLLVMAGGKLSSLGGTVADKVARRFLKEMMKRSTP
jgi:hypothetical protein